MTARTSKKSFAVWVSFLSVLFHSRHHDHGKQVSLTRDRSGGQTSPRPGAGRAPARETATRPAPSPQVLTFRAGCRRSFQRPAGRRAQHARNPRPAPSHQAALPGRSRAARLLRERSTPLPRPPPGCQRGRLRYTCANTSATHLPTAHASSRLRLSAHLAELPVPASRGRGEVGTMRLSVAAAISHGRVFRRLGLGPESRIHLLQNLLTGLVRHERIEASWARVDELRGYAEKVSGGTLLLRSGRASGGGSGGSWGRIETPRKPCARSESASTASRVHPSDPHVEGR